MTVYNWNLKPDRLKKIKTFSLTKKNQVLGITYKETLFKQKIFWSYFLEVFFQTEIQNCLKYFLLFLEVVIVPKLD